MRRAYACICVYVHAYVCICISIYFSREISKLLFQLLFYDPFITTCEMHDSILLKEKSPGESKRGRFLLS